MARNKRIYYATHQVGLKAQGVDGVGVDTYTDAHGVQSVGITTNFNLEQVFELGQLAIYENIEEIPDVEVTLNKVLDGYALLYHLATTNATSPTLAGRSNARSIFALSIFDDTLEAAEGTAGSTVACSGMYVSSIGYNFPLDDNFNEDLTLVGNEKVWANAPNYGKGLATLEDPLYGGGFSTTSDDSPLATGVNRREDMLFGFVSATGQDINSAVQDWNTTVLPQEVFGITNSGTNEEDAADSSFGAHLSNITISADLGREAINELGRRAPYHRFAAFPVEVTCEIEVTSISGDMVSATEAGIFNSDNSTCSTSGNLLDRTIRVATCEGTRIYLGQKNRLQSTNYTGGDAGGGNVTVTYTYTTFNDFTVMHERDPHADNASWWSHAHTTTGYLIDS